MSAPNLLFILTDQQRADTLAAYGNRSIRMPNLNRLADRSTVFARAYCTHPICTPSRGSIMTGLWPTQHGLVENNLLLSGDTPALPEFLPPGGRCCAHYGKWHLGDELFCQHGFHEWVSIEDQYNNYFSEGRDRNTRSSYHDFLLGKGLEPGNGRYFSRLEAAACPEEWSKPQFLASEAARFFRSRAADRQSFLLYVNFLEPHPPYTGPRNEEYDWNRMTLPASLDDGPENHHNPKTWLAGQFQRLKGTSGFPLAQHDDWKRQIARYWGLCTQVDHAVGRILESLEASGLDDNTIVVFTSDHGEQLGDHGCLQKGVMYEESVRIPLLVHLPGQQKQNTVAQPVSQIDLVPTLLDLLETPASESLPGRSLRPQLVGSPAATERAVFLQWTAQRLRLEPIDAPNKGIKDAMLQIGAARFGREMAEAAIMQDVRTVISSEGRWKLSHSSHGFHELYDLQVDPCEAANRIDNAECQGAVEDLRGRLRAWSESIGDEFMERYGEVPSIWPSLDERIGRGHT